MMCNDTITPGIISTLCYLVRLVWQGTIGGLVSSNGEDESAYMSYIDCWRQFYQESVEASIEAMDHEEYGHKGIADKGRSCNSKNKEIEGQESTCSECVKF